MKIVGAETELTKCISVGLRNQFPSVEFCDLQSSPTRINSQTILLSQGLSSDQLVRRFIEKGAQHLLQFNQDYFQEDILSIADLIENPKKYFTENAKAILPQITYEHEVSFSEPKDKAYLKDSCMDFIRGVSDSNNLYESSEAILEEMYMNAIFDAPRLAQKGAAKNSIKEAKIFLRFNAHRLAITCVDLHGSLDVMKFVMRLDEIYKLGASQVMRMNRQVGAGIGCSLMQEQSSSLFLGVIPGQKTSVTCLIPVGLNNRERGKINRSLHMIYLAREV